MRYLAIALLLGAAPAPTKEFAYPPCAYMMLPPPQPMNPRVNTPGYFQPERQRLNRGIA